MTIRMRHTRGHTENRRSHHALKPVGLSKCSSCAAPHFRHRACVACGMYKGRMVIDMTKKQAKLEKKEKEKANEQTSH